ncbi:MAG: signal peptide peptidase SppA [Pirellulaceae bacterium]|nr:signal peptide peptidase SppA [Pirellulaceae bacterium]
MESTPSSDPRSEQPLTAEVVPPSPGSSPRTPPSQPPQPPRKRGRSGCLVVFIVLIVLGGLMLFGTLVAGSLGLSSMGSDRRVREEFFSHNRFGQEKVAIITLEGAILSGEGHVKRQIDRAKEDDKVKAIVLRVDSPGGTVSGSDYIYHYLRQLSEERDIPIIVSMGSIAASGGYYVSMAVGHKPDAIYAEPTTWTGSIGVKIPHYDLSKLLAEWGIKEDTIASHELKTMGSIAKPMSEEERKIFQSLVDDTFGRFKQIIRDGRERFDKDPDALDRLATGQIYTADQALDNGLIDKIGFIEDAVDRAIEVAGLDKDSVRVVRYKRELTLASILSGAENSREPFDLRALLDATSPRAYYLYTWLPAEFAGRPRP